MQKILVSFILILWCVQIFSQEKQIEIDKVEITETPVFNNSFEVFGYGLSHLGERKNHLSMGASAYYFQYFPSRLFLKLGVGYGDLKFYDVNNIVADNKFYGGEFYIGSFLFSQLNYQKNSKFLNPFLGIGVNGFNSKSAHYGGLSRIDLGVSGIIGIDFKLAKSLQVGAVLNVNYMLSDQYDDAQTTSQYDILLRPGISLKYIFGKNKVRETHTVKETITVKPEQDLSSKSYPKYEVEEIEPYVEVNIVSDARNEEMSTKVNAENNTKVAPVNVSENNKTSDEHQFLFFTIQIGTYFNNTYPIETTLGVKQDFVLYNGELDDYNYMLGFYGSSKEAFLALEEIKNKVPDAFVAAVYKNERIPTWQARNIQNTNPNIINLIKSQEYFKNR